MNKLRLAACGVDCNECSTYNKKHDIKAAESLVKWYKERGWIKASEGAEAVQKNPPFCNGCWAENPFCGCGTINFRTCCVQKNINHCGECDEFPCEPYKEWAKNIEHHERAMKYLLSLKRKS